MFGSKPFGASYFGEGPGLATTVGATPTADVIVMCGADDISVLIPADAPLLTVRADDVRNVMSADAPIVVPEPDDSKVIL